MFGSQFEVHSFVDTSHPRYLISGGLTSEALCEYFFIEYFFIKTRQSGQQRFVGHSRVIRHIECGEKLWVVLCQGPPLRRQESTL